MLVNEHVTVWSRDIVLVPYSAHHVPKYHEWMGNPEMQQLTASEPLTLAEEYDMQRSWRKDGDKLTFIVAATKSKSTTCPSSIRGNDSYTMIGDINLFLCQEYDAEGDREVLVGEIELMIAEKDMQGKGLGRSSLLLFLDFVLEHERAITDEYRGEQASAAGSQGFDYFRVKIGEDNRRSRKLFESLAFEQVGDVSFFGEVELRRKFTREGLDTIRRTFGREKGREVPYEDQHQ